MDIVFIKITLLLYFLGTAAYWVYLSRKSEKWFSTSLWIASAGFIFHTTSILSRMISLGYFPLSKVYESITFFSWALVVSFLFLGYRYKIHILGLFALPIVLVSLCGALLLPKDLTPLSPILQSNWFIVHTVLSITGFVFFAVAFSLGLMYLIQDRLLKKKKLTSFFHKLPPLHILDKISQKAISIGFFILTLGIMTGFIWARSALGSFWVNDPKMFFALITWIYYLMFIHGRYTSGWRSKKAAYLSVAGFVIVCCLFIISTFIVGGGWHAFF